MASNPIFFPKLHFSQTKSCSGLIGCFFQRASTVQFNFLSFDELVPFLPKFRFNQIIVGGNIRIISQGKLPQCGALWILGDQLAQHEPVERPCSGVLVFYSFTFTFTPTIITSTFTYKLQVELFQLFLPQVQGITSLTIGEEGNPLYAKNWRPYAIFRWQFCKCANVTFCALFLWHLCKQPIFQLEMLKASILGSNIGGSSTWTIKRWEEFEKRWINTFEIRSPMTRY